MGRVNQSLKQRAPMAPQKGDLSAQKNFKNIFLEERFTNTKIQWEVIGNQQ